jgi:hypothetical protein
MSVSAWLCSNDKEVPGLAIYHCNGDVAVIVSNTVAVDADKN